MTHQQNSAQAILVGFWLLVIYALCFPLMVKADFTLKEWTRWRDILIRDTSAPSGHVLVALDGPVFASSQMDLRDLRIVDEQGAEVPSKQVLQYHESNRENRSVEMLDLTLDANGNSSFTLDLGRAPERHNRVEIQTPTRNFSRQVRIQSSDDKQLWALVRNDGYIFDFSRDTAAQYLEISYPVSTKRYLRVTILNDRERPIEISDATVHFFFEQEETLTDWPVNIRSRTVDQKLRATILELDLGYAKLPTSRMEIKTQASNFHRHVEIEGSNQSGIENVSGQQFWVSVGNGEIFSVALDRANRRQLQIDYPESRYRFLKVKIFHYDDRPLEVSGITVSGHPRRVLFRRDAGKSYRLFYGNAAATAPRYDLERLSSYLELSNLPVIGLGEEHSQTPVTTTRQPWLEKQPIWLWTTMAGAALLLGWLIYRLAKMTGE